MVETIVTTFQKLGGGSFSVIEICLADFVLISFYRIFNNIESHSKLYFLRKKVKREVDPLMQARQ